MLSLKVFIADDDELFLDLFREMLEITGYRDVMCMSNAQDALQHLIAADQVYDCIFLDINMPGIDGIDLCQRVRRIERYRDSYVIMVSSDSDRNTINDAFLAGAMDYITKPFDPLEIRSRLRIARKYITEKRENRNKDLVIELFQQKLNSHMRHDMSGRSSVDDVNGFLEYVDFENKILRSKKTTLMKSEVFGISIVDVMSLNRATTDIGFHAAISDIARRISEATELFQRALTYVGNGVFICLCNNNAIGESKKSIRESLESISEFDIELNDEVAYRVQLEISSPVKKSGLFLDSSIKLIYSAMESLSLECGIGDTKVPTEENIEPMNSKIL